MSPATCVEIRKPRTDEQQLWDLVFCNAGHQALLIAHKFKLFSRLVQPRTLTEVCETLNINQRSGLALLTILVSNGLVEMCENCYSLSPLAEDYLLESSPTYFGHLLDMILDYDCFSLSSFEMVKNSLKNGCPQFLFQEREGFEQLMKDKQFIRTTTDGMHSHAMASALAWPEQIDLSRYSKMLDVGGGSGAHSIGAVLKWPNLQAVVFDQPLVCEVAREWIARYDLQNRIDTYVGNMWTDRLPEADIHFYCDVYHGSPPERNAILTQNSFDSLPKGGRIIIHEMLLDDLKTGPSTVAAYNLTALVCVGGQEYSGREFSTMLADAGFVDIEIKPTFGYWSIVTGCKP